jgi:membrane glycosyltransferase
MFSRAEFSPLMEKIVNKIGNEMLTYYSPVFILLALTLAGSIIGALSLARREDSDQRAETSTPSPTYEEKIYLDKKNEEHEQEQV